MKTNHLVLGILADVDAGKTTLSENILFNTGSIRKVGRVDHGDTFLDTDSMERERGITIFSKQALFSAGNKEFTLLDTPGHADFSAETERTLSVLDYCILVISAQDGLTSHVFTLWKLLSRYAIPTFIFINKTDLYHKDLSELIGEMNRKLSEGFVEASESTLYGEECAVLSEDLLERFLETGSVEKEDVQKLILERKLFPVFSGSALKNEGVTELITSLSELTGEKEYPDEFSASVFKITRNKADRLSHLKVTGGVLRVKDNVGENKVEQIRLYQGDSVKPLQEALPGMVVAVTGLADSYAGEGIGAAHDASVPVLVPLFSVTVLPTFDVDQATVYKALKELEEEIPELSVDPFSGKGDVRIKLMGTVQTEIIRRILSDRFGIEVRFGENRIVYKETVCAVSEGVGHFEPLRHYAEVHLLLEPAERGTGMTYSSELSEDVLPGHFQRLILSQLEYHRHKGVLLGAELTDVHVTLIHGKHHVKHTVGGDFRQASYRALRHGLMKNVSKILEPYYDFEITLPTEYAGRAMSDITTRLSGNFEGPDTRGEESFLWGRAPVSTIQNYQADLTAYTKGFGRMSLQFAGYFDCHNPEEILSVSDYDPDADLRDPAGSVFCEHGAGLYVPWQEVEEHMHLPLGGAPAKGAEPIILRDLSEENKGMVSEEGKSFTPELLRISREKKNAAAPTDYMGAGYAADKELEEIFNRTFARNKKEEPKRDPRKEKKEAQFRPLPEHVNVPEKKKEYLLVDGYNIIHAWDELRELMNISLDGARQALLDILSDYQGFQGNTVIAVFDAYRVKGGTGSVEKYAGIYVVYTKEAETADAYIEKTVHEIGHKYNVTVATSDALEQVIVFGEGAVRLSAREFREEVMRSKSSIRSICEKRKESLGNRIPL